MPTRTKDEILQEKIAAYKEAKVDSRTLALLEEDIWTFAQRHGLTGELTGNSKRRAWLSKTLGITYLSCETRSMMLRLGDDAAPLWDHMDSHPDTTWNQLREIVHRGKTISKQTKKPLKVALNKILSGEIPVKPPAPEKKPSRPPADPTAPIGHSSATESKEFKAAVKALSEKFLESRLSEHGIDDTTRERLSKQFLFDVSSSVDDLLRDISRERKNAYRDARDSRSMKRPAHDDACMVLGIRHRWGTPLELNDVKRAYRTRMFDLHPDRSGGETTPEVAAEIQAVTAAKETLEEYAQWQHKI